MKLILSFRFPLWLAALGLLVSGAAAADPLPQLDGILKVGFQSFALFKGYSRTGHKWAKEGVKLGDDYTVEKINNDSVIVRDAGDKPHKLFINGHDLFDIRDLSREAARNWANSTYNPMLWHPVSLPRDIESRMGKLTVEERYQIFKWYRDYGWQLSMVIDANGYWDIGFENIYAEYRQEKLKDRVKDFRERLNPDQRDLYDRITKSVSFDAYQSGSAARESLQKQLQASLSGTQREAYDNLQNLSEPRSAD